MIRNYITIAFRSLWRNRSHSFINILGLGLGIASCILIVLFVNDELTFDRFHKKADRLYRVFARENWGENQDFFYTSTPFPMGPTLKENIPEVEEQVRIVKAGTMVKVGDDQFTETLTIADQAIFDVFDFEILGGEQHAVLDEPGKVVITDWIADKFFGESDPIGKRISLQLGDAFQDYFISGVAVIPTNSSIQFSLLVSEQNLPRFYNQRVLTSAWFNINPETYVLLREGADSKTVADKFPDLFKTILGEEQFKKSNYAPGLQPLLSIHLDTDFPAALAPVSNPVYSYILSGVAILILALACINFVTLSIGRSFRRAKEVGVRKVVGAARRQLVVQFLGEALLVTLMAMILGLGISLLCLPVFNDLSGKSLIFPMNGLMGFVVTALLLVIGLIAGSYPAFVLSAFRPVTILKGALSGQSKQGMRKALVGVQLVLSIFLISSTLIMRNQLSYLQNKDLGFGKEQLAVVQLNVARVGPLADRINKGFEKAELFKNELMKVPGIISVSASSHDFANGAWTNVGFTDDQGTYRTFNLNIIDDEYLSTMKMELLTGRNLSDESSSDRRRAVLINEAFVRLYGWTDAIGKRIPGKKFGDHEIVGVVRDFNYSSLYTKVEPLAMVADPSIILPGIENINIDNSPVPKLMVRLRPGNMANAVKEIEGAWDKLTGGEEFSLSFVDEALSAQYRADQNLGNIIGVATMLAIVIGALGLYGLASLTMQNRVKEVSIRKVLGATERSLFILLSREYVLLIIISLLISVPITWYFMSDWLVTFEYRVAITPGDFVIAGVTAMLIALITISHQAIKTAWSQPARTLKCE